MTIERLNTQQTARSIGGLILSYTEGDLDLSPSYQRGAVWALEQKRNLWKSLLMGLPCGSVFVNLRSNSGPLYVVDGKQRLLALIGYAVEEAYGLPRAWLLEDLVCPEAPEFVRFSQLSEKGKRVLRWGLNPLSVYETKLKTEAREAELYLLINFGGVDQTEEDRNRAKEVAAAS